MAACMANRPKVHGRLPWGKLREFTIILPQMIRKIQEKTGRNKKLHRKRQIKEMLKNQRKRAFGRSLKDMPKVLFTCHGRIYDGKEKC